MTTKDEAMKLALEALEFGLKADELPSGGHWDNMANEAITALRQAIREAALQKLSDGLMRWSEQAKKREQWTPDDMAYRPGGLSMEQEPVAWLTDREQMYFDKEDALRDCDGFIQPLYAAPVHTIDINQKRVDETAKDKHEPDAYGDGNVYRGQRSKDSTTKTLHYTALPRREWVGMTDAEAWEEWVKAVDSSNHSDRLLAFRYLRAIEAKLREKNT